MKLRIFENKADTMMNTAQMIKTASRITAFAAAGMLALAFAPAQAADAITLTDVTGTGTSLTESHTITFGAKAAASSNLGAWKVNEGTSAVAGAGSFWVYCLDPLNGFQTPDTYDKTSLSNFVNGGAYANLFAGTNYQDGSVKNMYDDVTTSTTKVLSDLTKLYSHAYADSLTSGTKSAAFQFAIWEIEGDGKGKNSDGKYYADGYTDSGLDVNETTTFTTQVNAYLAALNNNAWGAVNGANLTTATNYTFSVYNPNPAGGQALLRVTAAGTSVPEPGSLALAGLALFGVVYTRRQSKAKQA
jgi:hypothetical protein